MKYISKEIFDSPSQWVQLSLSFFVFCQLLRNTAHIQDSKAADKNVAVFSVAKDSFPTPNKRRVLLEEAVAPRRRLQNVVGRQPKTVKKRTASRLASTEERPPRHRRAAGQPGKAAAQKIRWPQAGSLPSPLSSFGWFRQSVWGPHPISAIFGL